MYVIEPLYLPPLEGFKVGDDVVVGGKVGWLSEIRQYSRMIRPICVVYLECEPTEKRLFYVTDLRHLEVDNE